MKLLVLFSALLASVSMVAAIPSEQMGKRLDAPPGTGGADGYAQPGPNPGLCQCNDGRETRCDACCSVGGGCNVPTLGFGYHSNDRLKR
ncbi:hypothetical protein F5884DRAFT_813268 [Xylogone sp. PMI_703]|nr:hypothetical protein F5884DRAFT_813268 [Xylogone sp. PMI_703]